VTARLLEPFRQQPQPQSLSTSSNLRDETILYRLVIICQSGSKTIHSCPAWRRIGLAVCSQVCAWEVRYPRTYSIELLGIVGPALQSLSLVRHSKNEMADCFSRGRSREGSRWAHGRDSRDAIYSMQNCRQWFFRSRLPDKALTFWRRCCHQESPSGQTIQGESSLS
jgi:hypothetical protein